MCTVVWEMMGEPVPARAMMRGGAVVCKSVTDGFYVLVPFYFCTKLMCTLVGIKYTLVRCPDWYQLYIDSTNMTQVNIRYENHSCFMTHF
jgi:hypothetical protein